MKPRLHVRRVIIASVQIIAVAALALGCASSPSPRYAGQLTFQTAEQAVAALALAVGPGPDGRVESLFGDQAREVLSSGDADTDRRNREVFAVALAEQWSLERTGASSRELIVGDEQWPFPIPLVRDSRGWWFDTAAGAQEILARRVGRNELAAIAALQAYVAAQHEYAAAPRDGRPAGAFAQRIRSDPGTHNGLYWPASEGQERSPLAGFAAEAIAAGHNPDAAGSYFGYVYRLITRQGPDAPGGAMDYVVSGDMTRGFAMIASPVTHAQSGIMTFIVGPNGELYETDLGPDTAAIAAAISEFNPDSRWSRVR